MTVERVKTGLHEDGTETEVYQSEDGYWVFRCSHPEWDEEAALDFATKVNDLLADRRAQPTEGERFGPVDQPGENECWIACLASLTGLALEDFPTPPAERSIDSEVEYHNAVHHFMRANGFRLQPVHPDVPAGHAIAIGPSPRREGIDHCVVTLGGEVVHDPHPSRAGVPRIESYEVVVPLILHPVAPTTTEQDDG
jgi:hypothetical protein